MDTQSFDRLAMIFASRRTRRAALRGGGVGLAAAAVAPLVRRTMAQEATPAATPAIDPTNPHPSADGASDPVFMFVQPFAAGTWSPKAGEDGVFTLTLSGAPANTVYFSDRPDRIFGLWPTQQFLDGLGFTPENPPNAAVVAQRADGGEEEVLVVELLNPAYDEEAATLTYDATVLADYGEAGLAHAARQQTNYELPGSFAAGGLFIDGLYDCNDGCAMCYQIRNNSHQDVGLITNVGLCGSGINQCNACNHDPKSSYYGKLCAETYPDRCSYYTNGFDGWDCFVREDPDAC